jgi:hypothetical protein
MVSNYFVKSLSDYAAAADLRYAEPRPDCTATGSPGGTVFGKRAMVVVQSLSEVKPTHPADR